MKKVLNENFKARLAELEQNRERMNISAESIEYIQKKALEIHAKNYLEIGLFNGYSALKMCSVCNVTSLEISPEFVKLAEENFKKAHVKNIEIIQGDARSSLDRLIKKEKKFDVILLDALKEQYAEYLEKSLKLIDHGFIFADNTISHKEYMEDFFGYLKLSKLNWKELGIGRGLVEIEIKE